jgi:peptidyl-prolyl cis-trans isomerase SurA
MTERDLRVRYRQEVRDQILKQKLIQRKLASVAVSNGEVREFYARYQDSLPVQPEAIKLAHILMPVTSSDVTVDSARTRLTDILLEINSGLEFEEAARRYSTDLSAASGGDLGWFGQGDMVPTFEQAAMSLTPGQISGVVQTRFGLHLIQCVEKSRGRVHARHILLSLTPSLADSARVYALADSLTHAIRDGQDFCALAQTYSQDEESRKNCGELGWYPIEEMFPEFKSALTDSKTGEVVGPVSTQFGWHILRVIDRRNARTFDLANDWDTVREMARREKTNKVVEKWIGGIRAETYIDVRSVTTREQITP